MKYFYDTEFHEDGSTIDLISIGIVAADGREYYAVNMEADWERIEGNEWLMANVVPKLPDVVTWKPKAQIAREVREFLQPAHGPRNPELWAWFSSYDHVVLAQLWGRMMDLPYGIPMFTHDLRAFVDYLDNPELPAQLDGEHNALEDARWVKRAYEYAVRNNDKPAYALEICADGMPRDVGPFATLEEAQEWIRYRVRNGSWHVTQLADPKTVDRQVEQ